MVPKKGCIYPRCNYTQNIGPKTGGSEPVAYIRLLLISEVHISEFDCMCSTESLQSHPAYSRACSSITKKYCNVGFKIQGQGGLSPGKKFYVQKKFLTIFDNFTRKK